MPVPGSRHFDLVVLIPMNAAPSTGMVRYLAHRNCRVLMLSKPLRQAGANFVWLIPHPLGSSKQSIIAAATVLPGQQGVARSATRRSLDIVPNERYSFGSESIDMRRVNVVFSKAFQFRPQIVHTDQQHIRSTNGLTPGRRNWHPRPNPPESQTYRQPSVTIQSRAIVIHTFACPKLPDVEPNSRARFSTSRRTRASKADEGEPCCFFPF